MLKGKGKGKGKGSSFERRIARDLSQWLTGGTDSTQLIRSVSSGGWARGKTQAGADGWRHVGDLAPNGPQGEEFRRVFAVECKHHRTIDLWTLWTCSARPGTLCGWWDKLRAEAEEHELIPMLIFKANNGPIMVGLPTNVVGLGLVARCAVFADWNLTVFPLSVMLLYRPSDWAHHVLGEA